MGQGVSLGAPERIAPAHVLDGFFCGEPALDDWLRRRALANSESGGSRVFVVHEDMRVVGYYALASSAVAAAAAPGRIRRNMPDPIPVVVLGRLAVTGSHKGRGLGQALFRDAALRVIAASEAIGIRALLVHALSEDARRFYLQLGLQESPVDRMTLMVTLQDLRAASLKA